MQMGQLVAKWLAIGRSHVLFVWLPPRSSSPGNRHWAFAESNRYGADHAKIPARWKYAPTASRGWAKFDERLLKPLQCWHPRSWPGDHGLNDDGIKHHGNSSSLTNVE